MLGKTIIALLLFCTSTNFMVSGVFHHRKFNSHISHTYENSLVVQDHNKSNIHHKEVSTVNHRVTEKYGPFFMTMPLDHFGNKSKSTFQNKYWVNTDYYKAKGPIILYNVGEAAADSSDVLVFKSAMAQLAQKLNGIVVIMEHRFYGTSGPKVKTFFNNTKDDLETFNSKQALADMAYLVKHIKFRKVKVPPVPRTKVVVYGCSYSGALSAWARKEYPNVFFASVASSAPVEAKIDFYEYFDPIMRYGPKACISAIENVVSYVDNILFNGTNTEVKALKKRFHAENLLDQSFAELLMGSMSGDWQYGIGYNQNAFENNVCSYFSGSSQSNIHEDLASFTNYINRYSRRAYCDNENKILDDCLYDSNFTVTQDVSNVSDDEAAWTYQTCTEFGYYQGSPPEGLPTIVSRKFGLNYSTDVCQKYFSKYNVPILPDVDATNAKYQGWDIQLNRTIWIDGEWDSWRELSVNSPTVNRDFSKSDSSVSMIIPKSTHCANVAAVTDDSAPYLKDLLKQQYNVLKNWLESENY